MKTYTFFKIKSRSGVPDFEIECLANPDAALLHAHSLLARSDHGAIEIWDGADVKRIAREDWLKAPKAMPGQA